MRTTRFINRERELDLLERRCATGRAELVVLYGRRRVGKTELLRRFCEGKRHLFFIADLGTEASALAELARRYGEVFHADAETTHFANWDQALKALAREAQEQRLIVVLDEFTYLIQANAAIPSIIQRLWDETLQHTQMMLILSGSYVGLMEKEVLAYRAPLYGRRTAQWHLQPLAFQDARRFLPGYSVADQMRAFAVLGGVPAYLRQFDDQRSLLSNIEMEILSQGSFLHDEPRFLVQMELREPRIYFAVLEAVANGHIYQRDIARAIGFETTSLNYYLSALRDLGLLERLVPATEEKPARSRRGRYQLKDRFFRFWFRFVYRERAHLERGDTARVRQRIAGEIDAFTSTTFEDVCREAVWGLEAAGRIPFVPYRVGAWWDREGQIDVTAVGDEYVLLGECKWQSRPSGPDVLADLKRRATRFPGDRRQILAIFSRAGFTTALQEAAASEGVLLLDVNQILSLS